MASVARIIARGSLLTGAAFFISIGLAPSQESPASRVPQSGSPQAAEYVPGEILVKLRPGNDAGRQERVRTDLGAVRRLRLRSGAEHWRLGPGLTTEQAIARLRNDPRVEYVEPNYIVRTTRLPNDARFYELWGLFNYGQTGGLAGVDINAERAWNVTTGSRSVLVGVVDTGIDYTHPDLAANIYSNVDEIPDNGVDDDENGFVDDVRGWDFLNHDNDPADDYGHGTHVAGTIGAAGNNSLGVAGVAWEVTLVPLKFIGANGLGDVADAAEAIDYATRAGVDVINASWGGPAYSQTLRDAIHEATDAGILFVAAAGNAGVDADRYPHFPSGYDDPGIVSVAATDHRDELAYFSNYGVRSVDLAAPGLFILSTLPGGDYIHLSGTSMAAPHVSGVAALLRSVAPRMGVEALKQKILGSVDIVPALAGRNVSGGRLNAFRVFSDRESVPPGACADLGVSSAGSFSLTLTWTATGDDGGAGTASYYEVRYATAPFDAGGFASALRVKRPPSPLAAGSRQSLVVEGLAPSTTYHFAVMAIDDWGNAGPMSALANGTTLDPPDVGVDPGTLSVNLFSEGKATRALRIGNVGAGDLTFDVAVRWNGAAAGWLAAAPTSGVVPSGSWLDAVVTFDAAGLPEGDYFADLVVSSNDPDEPQVVVPARLHVTTAPDISVSPMSLDFGSLFVGAPRSLTLAVSNRGTGVLIANLDIDHPDFHADAASLSVPPGGSRNVLVTLRPSVAALVQGTLTVRSNDPDHATLIIPLRGTGLAAPDIDMDLTPVAVDLITDGSTSRTVTLENTGGNDLQIKMATRLTGPDASPAPAATVLLVESITPFNSPSNDHVLSANGLVYDRIEPARLATTDLSAYRLVIVSSNQTLPFYTTLAGQIGHLSDYVASGGVLEFHAADWEGDVSRVTLPGGMQAHHTYSENFLRQDHPLVQGVPSSFNGSLVWFSAIPTNAARIVVDEAERPTLVEYRLGGGTVIAGGQAFEADPQIDRVIQPSGRILRNMIPYAHGLGPRWLRVRPTSGVIPPGGRVSATIDLDAAGLIGGDYDAGLAVATNDPDESEVVLPVRLRVAGAPDISLTPGNLEVERLTKGSTTRSLTIENTGLFGLTFEAVPAFVQQDSLARGRSLEEVRAGLNAGYAAITGLIQPRFDFSGGDTGTQIDDGGRNLYDGGNLLQTNLGGPLPYSDNVIAGSSLLGAGGRYFTRKYPGLFVLAADLEGVDSFSIEGNLGANGIGQVNGAVMEMRLSGVDYRGLVKRVGQAGTPTLNHLVIVADAPGALHEFSLNTDDDHHRVYGLATTRRLYYLLYAGQYEVTSFDDRQTLTIMRTFLETLRPAPPWVSVTPASGMVPPGGRATLTVTFDPTGLPRGDHLSDLVVFSNDPDEPEVVIPLRLQTRHVVTPRRR